MTELRESLQKTSGLRYVGVWVGLIVLTTLTFLLAKAPLGGWHLPVSIGIASVKAALIFLFFMHLVQSRGASRVAVLVALIFLGLLMSLTWADIRTRFPPTVPPGPYVPELGPSSDTLLPK
ncbi:MAG: cytochrome C oxidase subunit IV family protein [Myxococcaceae bacterium]